MTDQDPSIFPFHHIVPHRMKLLGADVLSWHDGPSMCLHNATIICLKLCQSWFQGCLLWQSISLAELGKQAPEMTQWYTVCLRSRVNLNFHGKYFAFKFTVNVSDDLCFAITVCVSVNSVFLITIVYLTPIAIA